MSRLLVCLLLAMCATPAFAQPAADAYAEAGRPFLRNYSPEDYDAGTQNWAFVQDARGVIYVGNNNGLLEYDGVAWRLIEMPHQANVRSLALSADSLVYVGSVGEVGYLQPDAAGQMQYVSLVDHLPEDERDFGDVWGTYATTEGIYFTLGDRLLRWKDGRFRSWQAESSFHVGFAVRDTLYLRAWDIGLLRMENDTLQLVPQGVRFADERIYAMLPYDARRILVGTRTQGLFLYDGTSFTPFRTDADAWLLENQLYAAARLPDGGFVLATLRGGALLLDARGRQRQILNSQIGLPNDAVNAVYVDRQEGLWLALDHGLTRVEITSPVSYLDEAAGLRGSVQTILRHEGTLYVATMFGLYRLTTAPGGTGAAFTPVPGLETDCWDLVSHGRTLLVGAFGGVFAVDQAGARPVWQSRGTVGLLHRAREDENVLFIVDEGLRRLRYDPARRVWRPGPPIEGIQGDIKALVEDAHRTLWLGFAQGGVARVQFPDGYEATPIMDSFDERHGLVAGTVDLYMAAGRLFFDTEAGLRRFETTPTLRFVPDSTFGAALADGSKGRVLLEEDKAGRVWISTAEDIGVAQPQAEGGYVWTSHPLPRVLDAGLGSIHAEGLEDDPVAWFGITKGVVRYRPTGHRLPEQATPSLLRRVTASDSLVYGGARRAGFAPPILAYRDNALRFVYALPFFDAPDRTRYQVFLDGFDKGWSNWTAETQKDYTNLPGGDYVFRMRARNVYGMESEEAAFRFSILPPWYCTGWAYLIYVLLGLGLLYGGARAWNWRLEQKNRRLEAVIAERTREINQKNEENERLLLNILPGPIAERLKHSDEPIADAFPDVTVLFADLVGFTLLSQHTSAADLVALLNDLFSDFDVLALEHGVEKIKTIGDAYMAVCGLPEERPDHAEAMAAMALDMIDALDRFNAAHGTLLDMRVGINTGPVVAGVIGTHKFIYDLWGDTVNTAARMESHGVPGRVHVTAATHERLKTAFVLEARGAIEVKGKHLMHTYLLRGQRPLPALQAATSQPSVLSSETPS